MVLGDVAQKSSKGRFEILTGSRFLKLSVRPKFRSRFDNLIPNCVPY